MLLRYHQGGGEHHIGNTSRPDSHRKATLIFGIVANLAVLGYFKYANFFMGTVAGMTGTPHQMAQLIMPLGISFFTFQKITFLIDTYRHGCHNYNFLYWCWFVFFPQLIVGPIIHHSEMAPQYRRRVNSAWRQNLSVGLTMLAIGLFKKVVLADGCSDLVDPAESLAKTGGV